ncbi:MAG: hypothetical protein U0412_10765 [Nitrospira sp.]
MTIKFSLIFFLLFLLVSPQLAGCAALTAPYSIKDAGIFAEDADLVWLDNRRVLFHGHKGMEPSSDPKAIFRLNDRGLYLWDTTSGALELYDTFDARSDGLLLKSSLCVHDGVLTYVNRGVLINGKLGHETKTVPPKYPYWVNPHSCRYYGSKPVLVGESHQTIPLLEEHGYIDIGMRPEPDSLTLRLPNPNPAISFYSVDAKKSFPLPIGWLESRSLQVHYAPFRNAYLLSGLQYYDEKRGFLSAWPRDTPHRVWWLSPDGTIKKEELPNVSPLQGGWPGVFPIRNGLFVVAGYSKNMSDPGTSGGFVVREQNVQKVVVGGLRRASLSADG